MTSIILPSNTTDPSQIVSNTLPTTRVNPSTGLPSGGSPLQIGDRWYKPSMGQEGFYDGAIWLSAPITVTSGRFTISATTSIGGNPQFGAPTLPPDSIKIIRGQISISGATIPNDTNYWTAQLGYINPLTTGSNLLGSAQAFLTASANITQNFTINTVIAASTNHRMQAAAFTRFGVAPTINCALTYIYAYVLT
jgi:hypothetical protein